VERFGSLQEVREAAERAGRNPETLSVAVHLPTYVHDGDEAAGWREVMPAHHYVAWKYEDMDRARSRPAGSPPPPPRRADDDEALREQIVFGDAAQVAERIRSFADAAGGDLHFIARLYWPGLEPARQQELLRRFGEGVFPLLR
jgi:alkanesulfonate monooxygenase SsuD/methylene tetrahydromethanopterin reductase-like flavin-dependent oxidoreductase (luciferase family)